MIENAITMGGGEIRMAHPTSFTLTSVSSGTTVSLGAEKMPLAVMQISGNSSGYTDGGLIYATEANGTALANVVACLTQNTNGRVTSISFNSGILNITISSNMNGNFNNSTAHDFVLVYGG